MSVKRQIVLIPYWIQDTLRRQRLPLETVLNFPKLRAVVALSDLVALVALQECWGQLSGLKEPCAGSIVSQWFHTAGPAGTPDNQELSSVVLPLAADPSVMKELQARLFAGSERIESHAEPYITYDLTPEFAGAVIAPGFFGAYADPKLAKQFVRAVLKTLYVYEPHHEVAKTPLFRRYLSLLSV